MDAQKLCAFVTFHTRADAETAIRSLTGAAQLVVKGTRLRVMWAKKKAKGAGGGGGGGGSGSAAAPPPGVAPKRKAVPPPPGVSTGASYPSTNPDALGAKPDVG